MMNNLKAAATPHAFDPPAEPEWHRMIAEAAYFRAQKKEFAAESALENWLGAEQEVKALLSGEPTASSGVAVSGAAAVEEPRSHEQSDAEP
jgi:hypothetical protein